MPRGIYAHKLRPSKCILKKRISCSKCHFVWAYNGVSRTAYCPVCSAKIDARDRSEDVEKYMASHPARRNSLKILESNTTKEDTKRIRLNLRKRVLATVSKSSHPKCINCGCDDIRLLEVNHKNCGGRREYPPGAWHKFYLDITMLRRTSDDLEILCRVCNAKHYLESKYGQLPITVTWTKV